MELAARRGEKGFSKLVQQALDAYLKSQAGEEDKRRRALMLKGAVAADRAAEVRRSLEPRGQSMGMGDSLIAGIILANKSILLTRNRQHFARVPGLTLGTLRD